MDENGAALSVGFAIDTSGSYEELLRLQQMMDSTEAKILKEAASIERSTGNMLQLAGAEAQIKSFGNAYEREMQAAARSTTKVENAAEGMIRQFTRQAEAFGMTASQARAYRAEQAAIAAESRGLTEVAARLRAVSAELDRFERQRAIASAGFGSIRESGKLAGHELTNVAFQAQDLGLQLGMAAGSSAPLRMSLMALAQQGSQISGIMMQSGMSAGQFGRSLLVAAKMITVSGDAMLAKTAAGLAANAKAAAAEAARTDSAVAAAAAEAALARSAYAAAAGTDAEAAALLRLAAAKQALAAANGEAVAAAGALKVANEAATAAAREAAAAEIVELTPLAVALGAVAAVAGVAAIGIAGLQKEANNSASMKKYAESLGLTAKEIRNLDDVTVTWGDTAKAVFQVAGRAIWSAIGPAVTSAWETMKGWMDWIAPHVKSAANFLVGGFVGAYNAVSKSWSALPAVMGDIFYSTVNTSVDAINSLIRKSTEGINGFIAAANSVLGKAGLHLPELHAPEIAKVNNQYAGAYAKFGKTARDEMSKALGVDYVGKAGAAIGGAIADQAVKNARDRIRAEAEKKGYLDPGKAKSDKHGEQLARENEAIEAQIRNLYALADSYRVSGAAALIAEAREKAESAAIKQRGDIDLFVNRQIRLAIAGRVSDAAKATAAARDQAAAQESVNAMVAAGVVPAERAAELVKDQITDLPLLAAAQAAQMRGLGVEAMRATKALAEQRAERERLRKAEETATFNRDIASGANRIAELREELRLVGATEEVRERALATLRATQEAQGKYQDPEHQAKYILQQYEIVDATHQLADAQRDWNDALSFTADKWDLIARNVSEAARGMEDAFGGAGRALGGLTSSLADYVATHKRLQLAHNAELDKIAQIQNVQKRAQAEQREAARYDLTTSTARVGLYGDMAAAAKSFFSEGTAGYQALQRAEQVFRAIQFALSVRAMVQDARETATGIANSIARTAKYAYEAVAKALSAFPPPFNFVAAGAVVAALASLGISIASSFGGGSKPAPSNTGAGTVLGNSAAQSESLKRSIDALKEVDTTTSIFAREMSAYLKSIDSQIAGFASVLVRTGNINASAGVSEGFKMDSTGKILSNLIDPGGVLSKIPVIGGIIGGLSKLVGSLFGSTTKVTGSGLYGGAQSIGSIMGGGFNAQYFSDIDKAHKFFGITTGHSYSTQYGAADPALANQFTLILKSFDQAILAAAGPLGEATSTIEQRLNGFVVNIGKIDLQGLTGEQIQEKLTAIFGAAADGMAAAAFPGIEQFQKVGEGAFETLVRVASTLEAVTNSLDLLGQSAQSMGMAAKLGLADQFDSVSAMSDAVNAYFNTYYSKEEQAAAKTAQFAKVFDSLGLAMPSSLAGFRQLVEAQDLTTAAGQSTYAMLLKLAPAFADLQSSLAGAKSAADILSERQDLERQLLELQGNTDAIRQLELAKLDASNRALQMQIWAIQDAQEAAKAADELRQAWQSVGDSIMDEVKRIRGLSDVAGGDSFASLLGQFNAANAAARGGDMDAAKSLPQLSQALLAAAANAATSRQELDRIQAQTAATLEATYLLIHGGSAAATPTNAALLNAGAASQPATVPANDVVAGTIAAKMDALRDELEQLRAENRAGHAATAGNTGKMAKTLDNVTNQSGGDAISTVQAA